MDENEFTEEQAVAVDWLLRVRQLQQQGKPFGEALEIANAEFPEG